MSTPADLLHDMTGFPDGWEIRDGHWQLTAKERQKRTEAKRAAEEKQAEQKRQQRTAAESPQMTAREKAMAKAFLKELQKRDAKIEALEGRVKQLESGSGSAERIAEVIGRVDVHNLKIEQLQNQCAANRTHVQNLEGKYGRLNQLKKENALPTFNPSRENL